MKKIACYSLFCLLLFALLPGCNCQPEVQDNPANNKGFTNPDDLADVYLKAIADKDMELLKKVFIEPEDLAKLNMQRRATKQHWETYFSASKRLFLNKNKDILGKKLHFLSFRPGSEIRINPQVSVFRGAQILAEDENGTRVSLEINFMIRAMGQWKILFLRYLRPNANIGQGPKVAPAPKNGEEPAMKIPGPKPKAMLKVKKVEKDKKPESEKKPDSQNADLEELKQLFEE